jgi:tyrosyl-tRNA synthetase
MAKQEFEPVEMQFQELTRGVVDLTTEAQFRKKLERSFETGTPLTVKVGFDPTAPDIHLGHAVLLRKMRQFQDFGHRVIFLIGDFTGMIGDPTGRSKTRPALTEEQILENAETYKTQCQKVLDPASTEVRFNSEWLGTMSSSDFIRLAARYNVARMLERNDFKKRYNAGQTISIHEFLYPLAQAYDSVFLEADVELGGTDQLFNLNVGRDIMPSYDLEPQVVLTTPLLEGLDGTEKMSKSLDNYVGLEDAPGDIFGKLMSISDELMWRYYILVSSVPLTAIENLKAMVEDGSLHPKKAKEGLALGIIRDLYDEKAASDALQAFRRVFEEKQAPKDIEEKTWSLKDGSVQIPELLAELGLAASKSEAGRLLKQGAVKIDGKKLDPTSREREAKAGERWLLQVGKRRFAGVTFE